jgi:hypothetical protein
MCHPFQKQQINTIITIKIRSTHRVQSSQLHPIFQQHQPETPAIHNKTGSRYSQIGWIHRALCWEL